MTKQNQMSQQIKLTKLLSQNPDREILFMIDNDMVNEDYAYTLGGIKSICLDEYVLEDERIYFKDKDEEELVDEYASNIWEEKYHSKSLTDEEDQVLQTEAQQRFDQLQWKKAIVVYIV